MIEKPGNPEESFKLEVETIENSVQSMGGKARAKALTGEERRKIARDAAVVRWADERAKAPSESDVPYSMFRGELLMGAIKMECHVLSDGRRVFTQTEIVRVLTAGKGSSNLDVHLAGNPLIDTDLAAKKIIEFKVPVNPQLAKGREATVLIEICSRYLDARDRGLLRTSGQKRYAVQADIIIRSCAKVGIIALIDEATGYQKVRARNALQLKLQAFIAEELQEWALMFPQEFWIQLARLEGVKYSTHLRPIRWGKYIMMFVYDAIDKDIGKELRKKNPNPRFKKNHHQWLKQFGKDKVHDQIERVLTIMKLCDNMDDFRQKFARVFDKAAHVMQASFDDINWKS